MSRWKGYIRELWNILIYFAVSALVVFLIYTFVAQQIQVNGSSMEKTLRDRDRMIMEKISYRFGSPQRFDIVVFSPYQEKKGIFYIKRIIGKPGETVQILDGNICINGKELKESFGLGQIKDPGRASEPITLGDDEYFVLGDNRNNSKDSRSKEVGNISRECIIGKAMVRIWPFDQIKIMKHP